MSSAAILQKQADLGRKLAVSRTLKDIATSCRLAARELGFRHFLLLVRLPASIDIPLQIVISGMPQEWDRLYDHLNWSTSDPLIRKAASSTVPFSCDEVDWSTEQRTAAMRAAMQMHGLERGITIPLHGPSAEKGVMSLFGPTVSPVGAKQRNELLSLAQLYCHRIYASLIERAHDILECGEADESSLTARERQVLSLAARGDRAKVIAWKLKITPRTVTYFLRRATQKVGVTSVREAICKAALRGQIELVEYPQQLRASTAFIKDESVREMFAGSENANLTFIREPACEI
jgi:LuxR family quorum-sensing transcriptional regulator LasR